ncbi:MAG: endolytic transglycosylase MltG [Oscillospiraceae bacterium]|nr:endolytic transglycosylase MltG [Oscillospiraceae bacterium]
MNKNQRPSNEQENLNKVRATTPPPMNSQPPNPLEQPKKKRFSFPKRKRLTKAEKRERRRLRKESAGAYAANTLSGFIKATVYIGLIVIISVVLAGFLLAVLNDFLSLTKEDVDIPIYISQDCDLVSFSENLRDAGIIRFPVIFRMFATARMDEGAVLSTGEFILSPSMNYNSIVSAVIPRGPRRQEISVTIPEGRSVHDIIDIFTEAGFGTRERFEYVINYHPFPHEFLQNIPEDHERIFRLEGYLFPDTFRFFENANEETIIHRLLTEFDNRVATNRVILDAIDNFNTLTGLSFNLDDVINLASVIQSEALHAVDFAVIGGVFVNRLRVGMRLQSDATTVYMIRHLEGARREPTVADLNNDHSPFSTYNRDGLPAGPINNPSMLAINSALSPRDTRGRSLADAGFTRYIFFITGRYGQGLFALNVAGHEANIRMVQEERDLPPGTGDVNDIIDSDYLN